MKYKLSQIRDNPKHSGIYDKEQIKRLEKTIKEIGFMGAFPIFMIGTTPHLVSHHHRKKACENVLGKNSYVEVVIHNYTEDNAIWGMHIENLTQDKDKKKKIETLVGIRDYLKKQKPMLRDSRNTNSVKGKKGFQEVAGSTIEVSKWINRGIGQEIISQQEVSDLLAVHDNLNPEFYKKMEVGSYNDEKIKDKINFSNALLLARTTSDKQEQKELHEALEKSTSPFIDDEGNEDDRTYRVRTRQKIITKYKEVKKKADKGDKDAKKSIDMVLKGEKDIAHVGGINIPENRKTVLSIKEKQIAFELLFKKISDEIPEWENKILHNLTISELERMYYLLSDWTQHTFTSLVKKVIDEIQKKDTEKKSSVKTFTFEFNKKK